MPLNGTTRDATTAVKGKIKLAGVLSGTADVPTLGAGVVESESLNATIACRAYRSAAMNLTGGGGEEKVILDAENYDLGGDWDTTNGRFTAPVTGYYLVTANIGCIDIDAAGDQIIVIIYVNGSGYSLAKSYAGATNNDPSVCITDIVPVTAGQYIEMYADITTTNAVTVGSTRTFMSIFFVGV